MYSRLYTHILNHHSLVDHCASFNHIYVDSSLFGLFASYFPEDRKSSVPHILPHLVHQLSLLLYRLTPQAELSRAKNQLKSILVMALESRAIEVEDLGRQVGVKSSCSSSSCIFVQILVHGRRISVLEMCDAIDKVTPTDILRISRKIFGEDSKYPASLVVQSSDEIRHYEQILRGQGIGRLR